MLAGTLILYLSLLGFTPASWTSDTALIWIDTYPIATLHSGKLASIPLAAMNWAPCYVQLAILDLSILAAKSVK